MISGFFSNKELLKEYHLSRRIGSSLGHHTAVKVWVYGNAEQTKPIANATMEILTLNRFQITDQTGEGEIVQFQGGTYTMKLKAAGYADLEVPFTVKLGKHISFNAVMVPNMVDVYATNSKGGLAANASASIVDTPISSVTDSLGYVCLSAVPEGTITVEVSDENGNFGSKSLVMGNGKRLRVEIQMS